MSKWNMSDDNYMARLDAMMVSSTMHRDVEYDGYVFEWFDNWSCDVADLVDIGNDAVASGMIFA